MRCLRALICASIFFFACSRDAPQPQPQPEAPAEDEAVDNKVAVTPPPRRRRPQLSRGGFNRSKASTHDECVPRECRGVEENQPICSDDDEAVITCVDINADRCPDAVRRECGPIAGCEVNELGAECAMLDGARETLEFGILEPGEFFPDGFINQPRKILTRDERAIFAIKTRGAINGDAGLQVIIERSGATKKTSAFKVSLGPEDDGYFYAKIDVPMEGNAPIDAVKFSVKERTRITKIEFKNLTIEVVP